MTEERPWISVGERKIAAKCNNHVICIMWNSEYSSRFIIYIDDKVISLYGSNRIYERIVTPLVNGLVDDDVIDCLKLIASTYKDARTRTKYVKALTYIGANVKKWIGMRPGAYLRNQADLIHKKLLAFLCRNGWIVVDLSREAAYACIKQDDGYHFVRFGYFGCMPIILADILPELRHDVRSIKRLLGEECYEPTNTHWLIKFILELIPKEWWKPLDIDALILEYQLKQLP